MKTIETIIKNLSTYFDGKRVLEIACGDSDFSLNVSNYAKEVLATDITLERIRKRNLSLIPKNVKFREMNAIDLDIDNGAFDASVCYNALEHLEDILKPVLIEMNRVTKEDGFLIFISTWKMDREKISELKGIINDQNNLTVFDNIERSKYNALIIKKVTI